ncbi:hypothetical protein PS6_009882 [Mucor atramentarius]
MDIPAVLLLELQKEYTQNCKNHRFESKQHTPTFSSVRNRYLIYCLAKFDDIETHSRQHKKATEQLIVKVKSDLPITKPKGGQLMDMLSNLDEVVNQADEIGDEVLLLWWQFRQVRHPH